MVKAKKMLSVHESLKTPSQMYCLFSQLAVGRLGVTLKGGHGRGGVGVGVVLLERHLDVVL